MATLRGGEKFGAVISEIGKKLSNAKAVRVGFLENAKYVNGTSVAMVGAIQEYGAPRAGIPPRPYFRTMIASKQGEWGPALAGLLRDNDYDANKALDLMGFGIEGQLRASIVNVLSPPLSPVTLMLRKMFGNHPELIRGRDVAEARRRVAAGESTQGVSTKPLVWTAHMLNSVDHEVRT